MAVLGRFFSTRERLVAFAYNILVLLILIAVAVVNILKPDLFAWLTKVEWQKAVAHSIWFAMLGGVAISLKGIYDHYTAAEWGDRWGLWYAGRPFTAAIVGVMTYILLQVANPSSPPPIPTLAVAAFTLGTQERRFFGFLYEVAKLVLTVPGEAAALLIREVQPKQGAEGDVLILIGQGMVSGLVVTLDGHFLNSVQVSPDGSSAAGVLPAKAGAAGPLDVVAVNPDGTAYRKVKAFTYV